MIYTNKVVVASKAAAKRGNSLPCKVRMQISGISHVSSVVNVKHLLHLVAVCLACNSFSPARANADPIHFAIIGDYGSDSAIEVAVANRVKSFGPQFIVTTGDNNYKTGALADWDRTQGKYYSEYIKYAADSTSMYRDNGVTVNQFFPTLGNHDWDAGIESYTNYFELPGNERYYSFTRGPIECFVLSSDYREIEGHTVGSDQYLWAEQAIRSSTARWQLVFFHHPAYTYQTNHAPALEMRWPFAEWGVDGVFSGHNHNLQRIDVAGVPYFVVGASGNSLHSISGPPLDAGGQWFNFTKFGFLLVDAGDASLTFQFVDKDGNILDTSTVPEPHVAAYLIFCLVVLRLSRHRHAAIRGCTSRSISRSTSRSIYGNAILGCAQSRSSMCQYSTRPLHAEKLASTSGRCSDSFTATT